MRHARAHAKCRALGHRPAQTAHHATSSSRGRGRLLRRLHLRLLVLLCCEGGGLRRADLRDFIGIGVPPVDFA